MTTSDSYRDAYQDAEGREQIGYLTETAKLRADLRIARQLLSEHGIVPDPEMTDLRVALAAQVSISESMSRRVTVLMGERDRARDTAAALEQELAEITAEPVVSVTPPALSDLLFEAGRQELRDRTDPDAHRPAVEAGQWVRILERPAGLPAGQFGKVLAPGFIPPSTPASRVIAVKVGPAHPIDAVGWEIISKPGFVGQDASAVDLLAPLQASVDKARSNPVVWMCTGARDCPVPADKHVEGCYATDGSDG